MSPHFWFYPGYSCGWACPGLQDTSAVLKQRGTQGGHAEAGTEALKRWRVGMRSWEMGVVGDAEAEVRSPPIHPPTYLSIPPIYPSTTELPACQSTHPPIHLYYSPTNLSILLSIQLWGQGEAGPEQEWGPVVSNPGTLIWRAVGVGSCPSPAPGT